MKAGEWAGVSKNKAGTPKVPAAYDRDVTGLGRERFDREVLVHLGAAHASALRLTRDADRARDLVQDAVLRAFRAFHTFTPGTNARAWLLKIVYSVFVNQYHRARRAPDRQSLDALENEHGFEPPAPSVPGRDPWQQDGWTVPEIRRALDRLADEYRLAVLLVDVDELSYEEAAEVMSCAVGTVRSRLYRARRQLADELRAFAPLAARPSVTEDR